MTSIARAHASLLRSEPVDGAALDESPGEVRLWFDEAISRQFSSAQLFDGDSRPVPITAIRVDPADPSLLILTLSELPDGPYSVLYKVLSDSDGHFSQGLLVFGVGARANPGSVELSTVAESELPFSTVILRWLNFVVLAGTVGAIAMAYLVLAPAWRRAPADQPARKLLRRAHRRIMYLAAICASLAIAVGFGLLAWQSSAVLATLPEGASLAVVSKQILTGTRWGISWVGRQGVLLLIALFILILVRRSQDLLAPRQRWLEGATGPTLPFLSLVLVAAQAFSSHASALSEGMSLALIADAIHLLAADLWVGGLVTMAVASLPLLRRRQDRAPDLIRATWKPFSQVAALSVGVLAATGLYSAGRQVASLDALLTTLYGRALMGKALLVFAVGLIGLFNSVALHPRLARPLAQAFRRPLGWTPLSLNRLPILVVAEGAIGILVLLATGVLTASPAPRGSAYTLASEEIPNALSQTVDDMVITFGAKPNRPGQNVFTVFAASTRRPPRNEIARVILRFNYQEKDIGRVSVDAEEIEPGRYMIAGDYLNLTGPWQVDVVIRRLGREDSVARFDWDVAIAGETQPVIVSRVRLQPYLTLIASLLFALLVAGAVVSFGLSRTRGYVQRQADVETTQSTAIL